MKKYNDSEVVEFNMLKSNWSSSSAELPKVITSPELAPERRWYLHDNNREICQAYC